MRNAYSLLAIQHAAHRPVRTLLTIAGVAIGVAAAMAIHIANVEVLQVFQESVTTITGESTIEIVAQSGRLDEQLIAQLRRHPHIRGVNPVLREPVILTNGSNQATSFILWGLDLVDALQRQPSPRLDRKEDQSVSLEALVDPRAVFLDARLAQRLELKTGDQLQVSIGGSPRVLIIRGVMEVDQWNRFGGDSLVMDIASAQELLGAVGQVDAIHVLTKAGADIDGVIHDLKSWLPSSAQVDRPAQRNRQVERMVRTFQLNLTTMSLVGLLVGVFLVYNTIAFSVVQHRREIGILRAIGMSRLQVSSVFLVEAAGVGMIGGMLGTGLGGVLAEFLTRLVTESISELYTPVNVSSIHLPLSLYGVGGGLGMVVAMIGAASPCKEAGWTPPARALAPGDFEDSRRLRVGRFVFLSCGMLAAAVLLALPGPVWGLPVFGYVSALCLLLGCACLGPLSVKALERGARLGWTGIPCLGWIGRLAIDQVVRAPGRASVTLSALMVGIAIMVGVGIMVQSFRETVEMWIEQTLRADLIIAPPSWLQDSQTEGNFSRSLNPSMIADLAEIPGVAAVDPYLQGRVLVEGREFELVARNFDIHALRSRYLFIGGESSDLLQETRLNDGIIVSEVLAATLGVDAGDRLRLATPKGERAYEVTGVFYDYATDGGKVVMDQALYERTWGTLVPTVLAVYLADKNQANEMKPRLEQRLLESGPVAIIQNHELRQEILAIFDRTFRITGVLQGIALVVAALGIANTLVTSVLERQRELATLRALGAGRGHIRQLIFAESVWLGLLGTGLGLFAGMWLSVLLIAVINKQAFGWTIHFSLSWSLLVEAVLVACSAAVIAGYVPARWAVRRPINEGLRYE